MRYYKLKIDNDTICELSYDKPCALRIRFNINSYTDSASSVPSIIMLNNAPISLFSYANSLQGKAISLEAGIDTDSPMLKALAISNTISTKVSTPIFSGKIDAVITDMSAKETLISFLCGSFESNFKLTLGSNKAIPFHISQGDMIGAKMVTFLTDNLPNFNWIDSTGNQVETSYQNKQESEIKFKSWNEIQNWLNNYNIKVRIEGNTATLYYNNSTDSLTNTNTIEIQATDLLEQPKYTAYNQCQLSCLMSSRYNLTSQMVLATDVIASVSSIAGSYTADAMATAGALMANPATFIGGTFTPLSIIHQGDSASRDAMAWATHIQAVKNT